MTAPRTRISATGRRSARRTMPDETNDDTRRSQHAGRREDDEREANFGRAEAVLSRLVGTSPQMKDVKKRLRQFAPTDAPMLLLGASGTGKGLAAEVIHDISGRSGPLEPVNCATLSRDLSGAQLFGHARGAFTGAVSSTIGAVGRANRGTLFLDEITDLPREVQPALLTVVEDGLYHPLGSDSMRHSNFRLIAATAGPIEELVVRGEFRGDLYARLRTFTIRLPDLDDRGADIILIAEHLLPGICSRIHREQLQLSPDARAKLLECDWPGNVRDLAGVLMQAAVIAEEDRIDGPTMEQAMTSFYEEGAATGAHGPLSLSEQEENAQRKAIRRALLACDGNKTEAAAMLDISTSKLYRLRKQLGID